MGTVEWHGRAHVGEPDRHPPGYPAAAAEPDPSHPPRTPGEGPPPAGRARWPSREASSPGKERPPDSAGVAAAEDAAVAESSGLAAGASETGPGGPGGGAGSG